MGQIPWHITVNLKNRVFAPFSIELISHNIQKAKPIFENFKIFIVTKLGNFQFLNLKKLKKVNNYKEQLKAIINFKWYLLIFISFNSIKTRTNNFIIFNPSID